MDTIISNPGLHHLVEKVFWNLDVEDLKKCAQINKSCKQILQYPFFGLRKFEHLSKENQEDWIKVLQSVGNSERGIAIISYLQWNLKKEVLVDPPCYNSPAVQKKFKENLMMAACRGYTETIKILLPLLDNLNAQDGKGETAIYMAANNGHTEIVKILAPLTENPNAPDKDGVTPIYCAAYNGHRDIVKFLAPFTDNPNAANKMGVTPSSVTKSDFIRRFLESYNSSKKRGIMKSV